LTISHSFIYTTIGSYVPAYYEYNITFYETGTYSELETTWKKVTTCSGSGWYKKCWDSWVPIQTTVIKTIKTKFQECFDSGTGALSVSIIETTLPTPLPGALPLFTSGLGALGFLGWRKKRKNSAAMAVTTT
jgi:hypothetical protein